MTSTHQTSMKAQGLCGEMPSGLIQMIVDCCAPEAIFCLGRVTTRDAVVSAFVNHEEGMAITTRYYLLLICNRSGHSNFSSLCDLIETKARAFCNVSVLLVTATEFYRWLAEGHRFAVSVVESAELVFGSINKDDSLVPLFNSAGPSLHPADCHRQTLLAAGEFLAGAKLFQLRKQYRFAAFMLHQSVEQVLRGWIEAGSGYRFISHNLERLLNWVLLCSPEPAKILLEPAAADKKRFRLLQEAYINARYGEYNIANHELSSLIGLAERLLECYGKSCSATERQD